MRQRLYLIAYDIADPRRLGRVARYLCRCAYRVQYSVFVARLDKSRLNYLLVGLDSIIDSKDDDIRVYPLPSSGNVTLLGQQFFATETLLVQNGHSRLELIQDTADDEQAVDES